MTTDRPNVLFIITDQQRADHAGYAGNPVVRTPNIDALAARGTVFDQAWVANPICMPNRASIMTGRLPSGHGVVFNDRSLDWGANTHVRSFRAAGWRTSLIGKSHLQDGMSRNMRSDTDEAPVVQSAWPEGWDLLEDPDRYLDGLPEWPDDFYGFEHVELSIEHGARVMGHHLHWALDRGGRFEDLAVPQTSASPYLDRSPLWWQVYRPPYGPELHSTTFVTDRVIARIREASAAQEPWLIWASFPDPHHPMTPPGDWFDRHRPQDMPLPVSVDDTLDGAPDHIRRTRSYRPENQPHWVSPFGVHSHELLQQCLAATYGAIEMIDDGIGQMVAAIEQAGQLDNTIIVFTSDHGDMMGDHGLMMKGFMHYRGTTQVPLIIVDPRRPAQRTSALACSTDIGPTLLDLCGLREYQGIQGVSLRPTLDDADVSARSNVLIEDDPPLGLATRNALPVVIRTLVTSTHRYTRHLHGDGRCEEQLFDLIADPHERHDLARTDAGVVNDARLDLLQAVMQHAVVE